MTVFAVACLVALVRDKRREADQALPKKREEEFWTTWLRCGLLRTQGRTGPEGGSKFIHLGTL